MKWSCMDSNTQIETKINHAMQPELSHMGLIHFYCWQFTLLKQNSNEKRQQQKKQRHTPFLNAYSKSTTILYLLLLQSQTMCRNVSTIQLSVCTLHTKCSYARIYNNTGNANSALSQLFIQIVCVYISFLYHILSLSCSRSLHLYIIKYVRSTYTLHIYRHTRFHTMYC